MELDRRGRNGPASDR